MAKLERKGRRLCIAGEWDDEKQVFSVVAVPASGHTPGPSEHEAVRETEKQTPPQGCRNQGKICSKL